MTKEEARNSGMILLYDSVKKIINAFGELNIPSLESEESAAQQGQGARILTSKQLIPRLPILLAQLQAGNNSQKLNNEIRQLVYSLYR